MIGLARSLRIASALVAVSLCASCAGKPTLYEWGDYQASLWREFRQPDGFDVHDELNRLETQVETTRLAGKAVPPGVHAHMGWLCDAAGDSAGAVAHFEAEKANYPESAAFVDGMLSRMKK